MVNETMTLAEERKMIRSFCGNFTEFQMYSDGHLGQGLHFAVHIVSLSTTEHADRSDHIFGSFIGSWRVCSISRYKICIIY